VAHLWLPGYWYIFLGALGGMATVALLYRNTVTAGASA